MTDERNHYPTRKNIIMDAESPAPAISPEDAPVCCGCSVEPTLVERMVKLIRALAMVPISEWPPKNYRVHAQLILAELEPVDPLLLEAREIVARSYQNIRDHAYATWVRRGLKDSDPEMVAALAALKRGMELAKEQGA